MVCGDSLYCDIMDLEAICGEVLEERQVWTNEIFRRKRNVNSQTYSIGEYDSVINETEESDNKDQFFTNSLSITPTNGDKRQMIEIVFKLVGMVHIPSCNLLRIIFFRKV